MSRLMQAMLANRDRAASGITVRAQSENFYSWTEVHERSRRVASALEGLGIRPGDSIAVLTDDPLQVAVLAQGAWMRRISLTMLQQPTARTDRATWAFEATLACHMIDVDSIIVGGTFAELDAAFEDGGISLVSARTLLEHQASAGPLPDCTDDDIALMQLTSGSTGLPKAVVVTHGALYANVEGMRTAFDLETRRDVLVSWLPLFHDMGMVAFMTLPMTFGLPLANSTPAQFVSNPESWLQLLHDHRGTMTAAPNFAYDILSKLLARRNRGSTDLSPMRCLINGSEPVNPTTIARVTAAGAPFGLASTAVLPCYGLAEATLAVSATRPGQGPTIDAVDGRDLAELGHATSVDDGGANSRAIPTAGLPIPGLEVKIIDPDGREVSSRVVGDVLIRGKSIARQYRTTDGLVDICDSDGWLNTGDRGYQTESGQLVICGRKKDIIIVSGRNIYPTDVERASAEVVGVKPGGAVAISLSIDGNEVMAVLVESSDHDDAVAVDRIEDEVRLRVLAVVGASPKHVLVRPVGTLPKTTSGKIKRSSAVSIASELLGIDQLQSTGERATT